MPADRSSHLKLALLALLAAPSFVLAQPAANPWLPLFDGKSLEGWRDTEFRNHGLAHVENGTLILERGKPGTGLTRKEPLPVQTNYELRMQAARMDGNDFFASVTFPVGESFCTWVAGGWGGDIVGLSSIDGWDASDNETRSYYDFENGRWYALRLRVTDERITAWIDEKIVIDVSIAGRRVGLRQDDTKLLLPFGVSSYATRGAIRKFEYRALPVKP